MSVCACVCLFVSASVLVCLLLFSVFSWLCLSSVCVCLSSACLSFSDIDSGKSVKTRQRVNMPEKGKSIETLVHCDADEQRFRYIWVWRRKTNRTINELMMFYKFCQRKKTRKDKKLVFEHYVIFSINLRSINLLNSNLEPRTYNSKSLKKLCLCFLSCFQVVFVKSCSEVQC